MRFFATLTAIFSFASAIASGESPSLGEYVDLVQARIEKKLAEALRERDAPDSVSGTVALTAKDAFFLQGRQDALKVAVPAGKKKPSPGDVVEVSGRPSLEGGRVVFVADEWRRIGAAKLPPPKVVSAADLVFVSSSAKNRHLDVNWRRITAKGRAIGMTENGFAMEIDSLPVTVDISDLPDELEKCGEFRPVVSVTGIAELILDQAVLFDRDRYVMGVKIIVDSPEDIEILPDLTYLVNRRDWRVRIVAVVVIALLALMLVLLACYAVRQVKRNLSVKTIMQERKRMADDLHDTIEQHLVGAGMLLQLSKTKEAREILLRAKSEMRDIVWGLKNDDMMRKSPCEVIKELAREETRKGICRVEAKLAGLPDRMDLGEMRDITLIIREAIGNAIKHGQAKKIAISCDPIAEGGWKLRVANDGAKFDDRDVLGPKEGHFGVEGMRERARRIGASITFSSKGLWMIMCLEKRV